ncbi:site-specific integrase [Larkinella sp. C7]|uniref:site-specific integrase n=1 Tax=Larkinella sp. C7 TaxID=2576607 RepID=UPI001111216B|nr:site-specific integrase [Larkinella sp. C7]
MEISRYIRSDRVDKEGFCQIHFRVCWSQRKIRFSSGQVVKPDEIIELTESIKDPLTGRKKERKKLQTKNRKVNRILDTYSDCLYDYFDGFTGIPTEAQVQAEVERIRIEELNQAPKPVKAPDPEPEPEPEQIRFYTFWDQFISEHRAIKSHNYIRHFIPVRDHLKRFSPELDFHDVTTQFANRFIQYMMSTGVTDDTAYNALKKVRAVMKYARKCGLNVPGDFEDFPTYRSIVQREALKWDEVIKLQAADLPDYLARQRDVFLFQCFTGLRWSDLPHARPGNLIEMQGEDNEVAPVLRLVQQKGRRENLLPLSELAIEILNKYNGKLPLITSQNYNEYIKEAAKRAGLNRRVIDTQYRNGQRFDEEYFLHEYISSHTGRHTFAMISLERKIDITDLSGLMGHGSIETTMIYRTLRGEDKIKVVKKAWGKNAI